MRFCIILLSVIILAGAGCTDPAHNSPSANIPPKTFLWLFPDSSLAEGNSKQHIRWWGEDPDGLVKGYVIASGKNFLDTNNTFADSIRWRFRVTNDTLLAFPLLTKHDIFQVAVRAIGMA